MKIPKLLTFVSLLSASIFLISCNASSPKVDNAGSTVKPATQAKKSVWVNPDQKKSAQQPSRQSSTAQSSRPQSSAPRYNDRRPSSQQSQAYDNKYKNSYPEYKESSLLLSIYAEAKVNLDHYGRSTPVNVHIFQLDRPDDFDSLDYETLVETVNPARLGRDFINKEIIELFPDEKRKIFLNLAKKTHYLGVVATYNDTSATRWKAVVSLQTVRNIVYLNLNEDGIKISQ